MHLNADGFCLQAHRLKARWYFWNLQICGREAKLWMLTRKVEIRPAPCAKQVRFNSPSSVHIYLMPLLYFSSFENWLLVPAANLFYQKRGKNALGQNIICKTSIVISFMPSGSCQKCWEYSSRRGGVKTKILPKETGQILQLQLLHTPSLNELPLCSCDQTASEHNREQCIAGGLASCLLTARTFD